MQRFTSLFFITLILLLEMAPLPTSANSDDKRILMVVSGHGQSQENIQPGYEFDEFAKAYLIFKSHNISVDVASPMGGAVEADEYDPNKPFNAKVLEDAAIINKLTNTMALNTLSAENYNAIFIVGGKGAMFDLPKEKALQKLIAGIYENNGVVAAVCHGPAALVNVTLSNGEYLVAGKAVNGFTSDEELLFGQKWINHFDFLLEDKLRAMGGHFQSSPIMLEHVATDGRLITGQNPSSTVGVAKAMLQILDVPLKPVEIFNDDRTLAQIARFLEGDHDAIDAITLSPQRYNVALTGMYGYYFLKTASTLEAKQQALTMMLKTHETINNPSFDVQIAKTQLALDDSVASRRTLVRILKQHPDFEPAQNLLNNMTQ